MKIVKTVTTVMAQSSTLKPVSYVYKRIQQSVNFIDREEPLISWVHIENGKRRYIPFKIQKELEDEYQEMLRNKLQ